MGRFPTINRWNQYIFSIQDILKVCLKIGIEPNRIDYASSYPILEYNRRIFDG
jgi:hypothetical protein